MAFPTGWTQLQTIAVDNTKVSGTSDLTNFVALIKDGNLSSAVYTNIESDGKDLRFTTDLTGTTEVPFEIVSITPGSSLCQIWLKIPTVSHDSNTNIYVWGDNSGASAYGRTDTYGSDNVWTGHSAVYHLEEASGTRADSSANDNTLADNNTVTQTTGTIDEGAAFDVDNSEYLNIADGSQAGLDLSTDFSIKFGFNLTDLPTTSGNQTTILGKDDTTNNGTRGYQVFAENSTDKIRVIYYDGSGNRTDYKIDQTLVAATDYTVVISVDISAKTMEFHIDGSLVSSDLIANAATTINNNSEDFGIGLQKVSGSVDRTMDGMIDEVRVIPSLTLADVAVTEFNNTDSPSTFWTVGGLILNITETLSLADSTSKMGAKSILETITLTDAISSFKVIIKMIAETLALTDIQVKKLTSRILTETLSLVDSVSKMAVKLIAETLTLVDSMVTLGVKVITLLETITLGDKLTKRLNGALVDIWSKIVKTASTFTKAAKTSSAWTKIAGVTSTWTKKEKPNG